MRNHKTAIQGSISSFHDLAAKKYFGEEVTTVECGSFKEVCDKIKNNEVDFGVIAIENRVAGSILLNYQLIDTYDLKIVGETYLPIELYVWGNKNISLKEIEEVISHPMALGQSQHYLANLTKVKVTEFKDTSTCAELVSKSEDGKLVVIAGKAVGEKYGLKLLSENICDVKKNYTRFYILTKAEFSSNEADKASIIIKLKDEAGSLLKVVEKIADSNINILKIQSIPVDDNSDLYSFHLDLEFTDRKIYLKLLEKIKMVTESLKVLGIYKGESVTKNVVLPIEN